MQEVCWAGQTVEGALAELASDRLGLGSLPQDLGVSPVDLQPEPAGHSEQDVLLSDGGLRCCSPDLAGAV